jgi:hypothetical protein
MIVLKLIFKDKKGRRSYGSDGLKMCMLMALMASYFLMATKYSL